jgi:hypothetical protein
VSDAVKTWRYLRVAMVALVVGLYASIFFEWLKVGADCIQPSISAYYYTPVNGMFVGVLVSVGVCLFCLKGSTDAEDILLNLAGMFAPVVALVPTPDVDRCASVLGNTEDPDANVLNNVTALLAVGLLGLLILAYLATRNRPTRPERVGYAVAALVWAAATLVFVVDRDFFTGNAHYTAAILMFACIVAVVCINAREFKDEKPHERSLRNRYAAIAGAMVGSSVAIGFAGYLGWAHWLIAIETALIVLFAAFWLIQTIDLWDEGLRELPSRP